jgi:predicted nucleotidyltransferase
MMSTNRAMLRVVVEGLGDLSRRVVFLGGATVDLYATDPGAPQVRPTLDVDCIVEMASLNDMPALESDLQQRGFTYDRSEGAPRCRWLYQGIKVDVMPTRSGILGFSNEWYAEGFRHVLLMSIGNGLNIHILEIPYFIATKLSALQGRGTTDLRLSKDFEDIVYLLRNRSTIVLELSQAEPEVKKYLVESFSHLASVGIIGEAITAVLDVAEPPGTQEKVFQTIKEIGSLRVG